MDRSSKSRCSVRGYFDRSSVGANYNQLDVPMTIGSRLEEGEAHLHGVDKECHNREGVFRQ